MRSRRCLLSLRQTKDSSSGPPPAPPTHWFVGPAPPSRRRHDAGCHQQGCRLEVAGESPAGELLLWTHGWEGSRSHHSSQESLPRERQRRGLTRQQRWRPRQSCRPHPPWRNVFASKLQTRREISCSPWFTCRCSQFTRQSFSLSLQVCPVRNAKRGGNMELLNLNQRGSINLCFVKFHFHNLESEIRVCGTRY